MRLSCRMLVTIVVFIFVGALCFLAGSCAGQPVVALPQAITDDTPCPVAGCTQAEACHAAAPAPEPDGNFVMSCPIDKGCASTDCHAWSHISDLRMRPSDIAMNLWIITPVVLVLALVALVRKL